jgi:regulatory protein YycH of two-component signal transduction system YycFG
MHHFNPLLLTDIKIGFEMKKINANFIFLKPSWFIKYNGDWQPLNYEKENKDGLE